MFVFVGLFICLLYCLFVCFIVNLFVLLFMCLFRYLFVCCIVYLFVGLKARLERWFVCLMVWWVCCFVCFLVYLVGVLYAAGLLDIVGLLLGSFCWIFGLFVCRFFVLWIC